MPIAETLIPLLPRSRYFILKNKADVDRRSDKHCAELRCTEPV
jgi:hypothetical protein